MALRATTFEQFLLVHNDARIVMYMHVARALRGVFSCLYVCTAALQRECSYMLVPADVGLGVSCCLHSAMYTRVFVAPLQNMHQHKHVVHARNVERTLRRSHARVRAFAKAWRQCSRANVELSGQRETQARRVAKGWLQDMQGAVPSL